VRHWPTLSFPRGARARWLLVLAAAWVVIAPIVPELHQAFAGHGHVFCQEHLRIEDTAIRPLPATPDFASAVAELARGTTRPDERTACRFANFGSPLALPRLDHGVLAQFFAPTCLARYAGPGPHIVDTLSLAPKQSPPLSA
jgi:hypothetical protein